MVIDFFGEQMIERLAVEDKVFRILYAKLAKKSD